MLGFDLSSFLVPDSPIRSSPSLTSAVYLPRDLDEENLRDGESAFPAWNEDDLESNATINEETVDDDDSVMSNSSSISVISNASSKLKRLSSSKRNDIAMQLSHIDIKLDSLNSFDCKKHGCCLGGNCTRKLTVAEICETQNKFWGDKAFVTSTTDRGEKIFKLLLAAKRVDERKESERSKSGYVFKFEVDNPLSICTGKKAAAKTLICEGQYRLKYIFYIKAHYIVYTYSNA